MPSLSAYISNTIQFDVTNTALPVMKITDNGVYPIGVAAGITGIIDITQPDTGVRTGSFTSPDIVYSGGILQPVSIPIRLNSEGKIQEGIYVVTYTIDHASYTPTILTRTFTVTYTPVELTITNQFDVFTPNLKYLDETNYDVSGYTKSLIRAWTAVSAPTGTITGNLAAFDVKFANQYFDTSYVISLNSTVTYTSVTYPWLSIKDKRSTAETAHAYTPPSAPTLLGYITTLKARVDSLVNSCENYDKAKSDYQYAYSLYNHLIKRICDNNTVGVYTYVQEILDILHNNESIFPTHTNVAITPYIYDCGDVATNTTPVVEVWAGTALAISQGIIVGQSTFINPALANSTVEVIRGNINLPGIPSLDGSDYYTKALASDTITFSSPIQDGEYIKIKIIGSVTSITDTVVVTQVHISGAAVTVTDPTDWLIINPTAILPALTITLPLLPTSGHSVRFSFGGTLSTGDVVTLLTVVPNTGHTILQPTSPTSIAAGDVMQYQYYNNIWYRIN